MGVEVATFLSGLVPTNPLAGDNVSQGDDHIRLLKTVLQATFPNADQALYLSEDFTDIVAAATTSIGGVASQFVNITGTTTITSFGTIGAGIWRIGKFAGILTLTHNASSLILPGGANIATAAGDTFLAVSRGVGNWVVPFYQLATEPGTPSATETVEGIVELATVAEAKARTDTTRAVTPADLADFARIKTGTYTGDGTTAQAITGVGFQPKHVKISQRRTSQDTVEIFETFDVLVDDIAGGACWLHNDAGAHLTIDNAIVSLDADGFTVSDDNNDEHPNEAGTVYNYIAIG